MSLLALQFECVWVVLSKTGTGTICIPQGRRDRCSEWQFAGHKQRNANFKCVILPASSPLCVCVCVCLCVCVCVRRPPGTHQVHGQLSWVLRLSSTYSILLFTPMSSSWCKVGSGWSTETSPADGATGAVAGISLCIYKCMHRLTQQRKVTFYHLWLNYDLSPGPDHPFGDKIR